MFSNVVVKMVPSCGVNCVLCGVCHKLHGTQYTPQLESLFTTSLLNI
jgi:hypothetical protein